MKWNAELYDQKHAFVYQFGENVLELLDAKPGEHILDIGCGTGYLTQQIRHSDAIAKGIDFSADMIARAKASYPDINFEIADASAFDEKQQYDAVFSNAALHWVKDQDRMMESVYSSLKPGGRFVAEMGGKGNVELLINTIKQVLEKYDFHEQAKTQIWYFPSLGEYSSKLESHGFRVTFAIHFDRKTPLQDGSDGVVKWIRMFGSQYFEGIPGQKTSQMLTEIAADLEPYYNDSGQWYADYKRLRFTAIKEL